MQATPSRSQTRSPVVFGIVLIVVGVVALALQQSGLDVAQRIANAGWPFFVIIPGLVLLAAAWIPAPPNGLGFATAGSIVTTIGLILMYGDSTGHWERWAYLWALIPGAAGAATVVYGAISARGEMVVNGLRTVLISAVLFVAGLWFFETTFATGDAPVDLGTWWPLLVIGLGVAVMVTNRNGRTRRRSLFRSSSNPPATAQEDQQ